MLLRKHLGWFFCDEHGLCSHLHRRFHSDLRRDELEDDRVPVHFVDSAADVQSSGLLRG